MNRLPTLPADKANHALYGNFAALAGALLAPHVGLPPWQGAVLANLLVATVKELWDRYSGKGTPDWRDVAATCAGGVPVTTVAWQLGG